MIRILATLLIATVLGFALGNLQAHWRTRGTTEFFIGSTSASQTSDHAPVKNPGVAKLALPGGDSFQFGQMQHGGSMSHDFVVRNVGTGPMTLEQTGSTCKCTVGTLNNNVLQPGEETTITLTWRAQVATPQFAQSATFRTNDPTKTEFSLKVEGRIIDSFVYEPDRIDLGDFLSYTGLSKQFMVYSYTDADVEVTDLEWSDSSTSKYYSLSFEEVPVAEHTGHLRAARAYKGELKVAPGVPLGLVSARVQVRTSLHQEITVPDLEVYGRAVSDVTIIGGSYFVSDLNLLKIGTVSAKQGFTTSLWLVMRGDLPEDLQFTVDQLDAQKSLKVQVGEKKTDAGRIMIPINFEVPKDAPEAYYPGNDKQSCARVVIRSNSSKLTELLIRVALVVTK
ncbi:MAG: DUF1573 domain-containing protein [Pirellulaceae bacterium]|nr:DUF1573 domain-containing protein [Pirellulaceae bacterium]